MENKGFIDDLIKAKEQDNDEAFMKIVRRIENFLWNKAYSWARDKHISRIYGPDDLYNIFLQVAHKCVSLFIIDPHLDDHQTYLRFFGNISRNVKNKGADIQWEQTRSVRCPAKPILSMTANHEGVEYQNEPPCKQPLRLNPEILIDLRAKLDGDHLRIFQMAMDSMSPQEISRSTGWPIEKVQRYMREVHDRICREFSKNS